MKKIKTLIPLWGLFLFVIGLASGACIIAIHPGSHLLDTDSNSNGPRQAINIPQDNFDATESIPGTSITVAYPKNGFFGTGIILDERFPVPKGVPANGSYGSFSIKANKTYPQDNDGSNASFDQNNTYSVQVGAKQRTGNALKTTIEQAVDHGSVGDIQIDANKSTGVFLTMNGHEFFVYKFDMASTKSGDQGSTWRAVSFGKKEIITVDFTSYTGTDPLSEARFRKIDQTFLQVLSHIKFD